MTKDNQKVNLLEHSEAKVKLYGRYLAEYLRVLYQANFVKRVFIFDLFCGEGIYQNGDKKGSPIIAIESISNHYYENNNKSLNITLWLNVFGKSDIDNGIFKVERVEKIVSGMFVPSNTKIEYKKEDFRNIYPEAISLLNKTKDSKGLFFIDPFGYKMIKPNDIRKMLEKMPKFFYGFLQHKCIDSQAHQNHCVNSLQNFLEKVSLNLHQIMIL